MSKERSPIQYFIGGLVGGVCVVFVGHPFDTMKVQMQTFPTLYKSMYQVSRDMIMKEGIISLYKGLPAPLLTVVPLSAICFFSYGEGKILFGSPGQTKLSCLQVLSAGTFSGMCTSIVTAPGERIKCILQTQEKKDTFFTCAKKIWQEGGIRNMYLGTCATLARDMPSYATYFYTYERLRERFLAPGDKITWQPMLAGGCAGSLAWTLGLPADAVKTRLQIAPMGTYKRGMRDAFPLILKEGGVSSFYRGIIPVLMRAFFANAACFYSLELTFILLDKLSESNG